MESKDSDVIGDHSSEANSGNLSSSASKSSGGPRLQLASRLNLENRHVNSAKVLLLFLGLSSIGASIAAFSRVTKALNEDAEEKFKEYASIISVVSEGRISEHFESLESLSLGIASYSSGAGNEWPLVTLPVFEFQSGHVRTGISADWIELATLVEPSRRSEWEEYSFSHQEWIAESRKLLGESSSAQSITPYIFRRDAVTGKKVIDDVVPDQFYAPTWQVSPPSLALDHVNHNIFDSSVVVSLYREMFLTGSGVLSGFLSNATDTSPSAYMLYPVYANTTTENAPMVAMLLAQVSWHSHFEDILKEGVNGVYVEVEHVCEGTLEVKHTFEIDGPEVVYVGQGSLHSSKWNGLEIISEVAALSTVGGCSYILHLFPSEEIMTTLNSSKPALYTTVVMLIFVITLSLFVWYDCTVHRRQNKYVSTAAKTSAIVDSFFPMHIRDRILQADGDKEAVSAAISKIVDNGLIASKPIADLFPHATVMFADIVGFTAWSSVREPTQVFTLLESLYNSFDVIAKRRRVFKVETIGDCYVAAAGLPDPRDDHAIAMARFAKDCLDKMLEIVERLELTLGPDTGELSMRFGLHSGPVTGGVLRGDKSRFQLFGDTVYMAAKIESTGRKGRIHLSKETAKLLIDADKSNWVRTRDDLVSIKGKGEIQTYWFVVGKQGQSNLSKSQRAKLGGSEHKRDNSARALATSQSLDLGAKSDRLVEWNVDVLAKCLRQIVAMRTEAKNSIEGLTVRTEFGKTILDEVQEVIELPNQPCHYEINPETVELDASVTAQLRNYVTEISTKYRSNPFHNFQHASHVTQSLTKLLSRVVSPEVIDSNEMTTRAVQTSTLHKFTFGITSDPLTQFACTFSALIHDVDHPGVPNAQLVREGLDIADMYNNKSCAEQHSVDLAWNLLMKAEYKDLRACIYNTQRELERFRQLVVNSVMATDVVDKQLGQLRKKRWEKAFSTSEESDMQTESNRKATIVIEHLIQAADVAHTMQHWHVYRKWNERFFQECYGAYLEGRAQTDPSTTWYEGELSFFDYYVIPLAKKLEDCGVFGVSSDECLNYAKENRREWEAKGQEIVQSYLQKFNECSERP